MSTRTSKVYILVNDLGIVLDVTSNVKKLYDAYEQVFKHHGYNYEKLLEAMQNFSLHLMDGDEFKYAVLKRFIR